MSIEVTVRHTEAMSDIQAYAEEKARALIEEFPGVEHVHVILDVQKHLHIAEMLVQARHRTRLEAKEASDNMRASIDSVADKTEKQLRKVSEKVTDHKSAMKHFEAEKTRRTEGAS